MKVATVSIAYNEQRFITPHLKHMPEWISEHLVLVSTKPWQGLHTGSDETANLAREAGASVIEHHWLTEHEQRNAGQEYLSDYDWVITLDPDEFLDDQAWKDLRNFLMGAEGEAYVCQAQNTYWKRGYVIEPREEYAQIIATRPSVRYIDKRVVDTYFGIAPVILHHFSWARTDEECLSKISHYAHAHELDPMWYSKVWLQNRKTNLHPLTPESLKKAVPAELPMELERLNLWPK